MAARTYVPELRVILKRMSRYLAAWTPFLLGSLSSEDAAALLAFQLALNTLIAALGPDTIGP